MEEQAEEFKPTHWGLRYTDELTWLLIPYQFVRVERCGVRKRHLWFRDASGDESSVTIVTKNGDDNSMFFKTRLAALLAQFENLLGQISNERVHRHWEIAASAIRRNRILLINLCRQFGDVLLLNVPRDKP